MRLGLQCGIYAQNSASLHLTPPKVLPDQNGNSATYLYCDGENPNATGSMHTEAVMPLGLPTAIVYIMPDVCIKLIKLHHLLIWKFGLLASSSSCNIHTYCCSWFSFRYRGNASTLLVLCRRACPLTSGRARIRRILRRKQRQL